MALQRRLRLQTHAPRPLPRHASRLLQGWLRHGTLSVATRTERRVGQRGVLSQRRQRGTRRRQGGYPLQLRRRALLAKLVGAWGQRRAKGQQAAGQLQRRRRGRGVRLMLDWARGGLQGRPQASGQPPRRQRGLRTQLVLSQAGLQQGRVLTGQAPGQLQSLHQQARARLMLRQAFSLP